MRNVTVTGATGAQQAAVARAFAAAGWAVRGTSRSGAEGLIQADPDTGEGLARAFDGADVVVFALPQDHRPGAMPRIARHVAEAARSARVPHVILNPGGVVDAETEGAFADDLRAVHEAICGAAAGWDVVRPTVYLENLTAPWSIGAMRGGAVVYPAPASAAISWTSHASLAEATVALANSGPGSRLLTVGGAEALTGDDLARRITTATGHPLAYQRLPLDAFAAALDAAMGPPAGSRLASLYAQLDRKPHLMAIDTAPLRALGVTPVDARDVAAGFGL